MTYEFIECTLTDIKQVSDQVRLFSIKFPDDYPFHFRAGQFIMLNLPLESKNSNRAYSIASPPHTDNRIELVISLKPAGKGTHYLWEKIHVGSKILVTKKPLGKYSLPDNPDRELCFISTGTGIAPLRSMLLSIYDSGIPQHKITLITGYRYEKDILFRQEFEDLEKLHPEFTFIPVLSRENPGWTGRTGYVHSGYEELFQDKRAAYFYLCGWKEMIKEARQRLQIMGYEKQFIRYETYD